MISIILPVFHSQRTLNRCIESILGQSYRNIELLIVIDGDDIQQTQCLRICESFKKVDSRINIITQENAGVDRARFVGLSVAKGEFVTFVDSDDWLEPKVLDAMHSIMQQEDYDYVEVSSFKCLGPIKRQRHLPAQGSISNPELFDKYYISFFGWNILPVSIWGKLYRRKTIEKSGLAPSGFAMGEDLVFNMKLFPFLQKIYLIDKPYYNYRFGGMTSRYNPHLLKDLKSQFMLKLQAIEEYSYHKADNTVRIEMVNVLHSDIRQRLIYQGNQKREEVVEGISKEIGEVFWCEVLNITSDYLYNSPFFIALKNCDADVLYDICKKEVDSTRIQRGCKRVASRMLNLI